MGKKTRKQKEQLGKLKQTNRKIPTAPCQNYPTAKYSARALIIMSIKRIIKRVQRKNKLIKN